MTENNNIIFKFKPTRILGKGSEGIVVHTHNNKYAVKIYEHKHTKYELFLKILNFLENCENLPKTVYKSYYFTKNINSFDRYISNNHLPNHFSIKKINDLKNIFLNKSYDEKLFEIMKYYKQTFKDFIEDLKTNDLLNEDRKIHIMYSLFQQGLLTLFWLYMEKGIIHCDFNYDNFFIEKTNREYIKFNINDYRYKIKLEGYYLVIGDFGYSKTIELVKFSKFPEQHPDIIRSVMNPIYSFDEYIRLFKPRFRNNYGIENIRINITRNLAENYDLNVRYKEMIRSYVMSKEDLKSRIKEYKNYLFNFMNTKILNQFI